VTTLHADWQAARNVVYGAMGCEPVYEVAYGQPVEQPLVAAIVARYGVDWAERLSPDAAQTMLRSWVYWARPKQIPPARYRWFVWMGGRGSGKTRSAAEALAHEFKHNGLMKGAILSPTFSDFLSTQLPDFQACFPEDAQPYYHRDKRKIFFPSLPGATCSVFSAEKPNRFRGPNLQMVWIDEVRSMKAGTLRVFMKMFRGREDSPQFICSTTPEDCDEMRYVLGKKNVVVVQMASRENVKNIGETTLQEWEDESLGTTYGRRELLGEMVESTKGALWTQEGLDKIRTERHRIGDMWADTLPKMQRVCISIDPNAGDSGRDECGIIVAGFGEDEKYYVLADITVEKTEQSVPKIGDWCRAITQYARHAETHYGCPVYVALENNRRRTEVLGILKGRESALRLPETVPIHEYTAGKGTLSGDKFARASLVREMHYEADAVRHAACGNFRKLHHQMTTWEGYGDSPDRLDALVQALMSLKARRKSTATSSMTVPTAQSLTLRKF